MTVKLPDVSEFQSPASGNAPNWAGIKSQNGGAAIIGAAPMQRLVTLLAYGTPALLDAAMGPVRGTGTGEQALARGDSAMNVPAALVCSPSGLRRDMAAAKTWAGRPR
jgi:hypothetical protein